jgi:integrase/recombinase XerD
MTSKVVEDFFQELNTRCRPRTVRLYYVAMQRFTELCNVTMPKVRLPAIINRGYKYLKVKDYVALHDACQSLLERALLSVTYSAAMRIGETLSRRMNHLIDFDRPGEECLYVGNDDTFTTKTSLNAVLPLTSSAVTDLKEYLASEPPRGENDLIFQIEGRPIGERQANRIWHRMLARTNIKGKEGEEFGWHTIRHTRATHLRIEGVPIPDIKDFLRHTSLDTTMIYAEIDTMTLRRVTSGKDPLEKRKKAEGLGTEG